MRLIVASALMALLALPSIAAPAQEKDQSQVEPAQEKAPSRHGARASQLQAKPVLIFNNYGMIFGPSFALELPVFKNFSIGGAFSASFDFRRKDSSIFDLSLLTKAFVPVEIGGYDASWYFGMPLGFSLGMFKRGSHPGFNFAMLPGFLFYVNRQWGLSAEFGYSCHALQSVTSLHGAQFALGLAYIF